MGWTPRCLVALLLTSIPLSTVAQEAPAKPAGPDIVSMSALAFSPDGTLFVGDAKSGAVFALEIADAEPGQVAQRFQLRDVETRLAALVGARSSEILIHDLAVHPVSLDIYLAVSRSRARWESRWQLPNELADASLLVRIGTDGEMDAVDPSTLKWSKAELPGPVADDKTHSWKRGTLLRTDAVTDLVYDDGKIWVAGLSNEEFASTMWRLDYPFADRAATKTTVEVYHGAHAEWETHAPIRTFVPYRHGDTDHILAAYLCTPLVTFKTDDLAKGGHLKGKTVAEMGSGNYPLDMVLYKKKGEERLLIVNSNLPLMIVDPKAVATFEGQIDAPLDSYAAGVPYEIRSGAGIQQLDLYGPEHFVALQRLPGGTLDLMAAPVVRY